MKLLKKHYEKKIKKYLKKKYHHMPDDCGTDMTVPHYVTENSKKMYLGCNIKEGDKIITLTEENIDSYVGETINAFSPMTCRAPKFCKKCYGRIFHHNITK